MDVSRAGIICPLLSLNFLSALLALLGGDSSYFTGSRSCDLHHVGPVIPRRRADLSERWSVSSATPGTLVPPPAPRKSRKHRSRKVRTPAVHEGSQAIGGPFVEKQQDLRFVEGRSFVPQPNRSSPPD